MDSEVLSISLRRDGDPPENGQQYCSAGACSHRAIDRRAPRELLGDVLQAFLEPGRRISGCGSHCRCRMRWNIRSGKTIFPPNTGDITDAAVSPDRKLIASSIIPFWDTRGYVAVVDLSGNANGCQGMERPPGSGVVPLRR